VRDGVALARRGIPVVALVCDPFWEQGTLIARACGMPDVPRVRLPYPVAGTGAPAIEAVAGGILDAVLAAWENAS
jgi:hypothetical protein